MGERWVLEKDIRFEAAHQLPEHDGKCARLHGHSWKGTIRVVGDVLVQEGPKKGMLIDYGDIRKITDALVEEKLDHHYLNDTLAFIGAPTSERVARWLYLAVAKLITDPDVQVESVTIEETCTARCTYTQGEDEVVLHVGGGRMVSP
jgi:6-pyruvoyltetrahydropterin/6-carboxytetrahydropterin synthase